MSRFDLILFGASGFTGGLVAEELARSVRGKSLRWALAGRNQQKLESVRRRLAAIDPATVDLPLVHADSGDVGSLRAMAESTRVLISTVGPYARYGEPVVAACVESGTDYVDLTGEPSFWSAVIDAHHERAVNDGVLVVPCCGFDSIPADVGTWFTLQALGDEPAVRIRAYVSFHGKISGGTWASALEIMADARNRALTDGQPRGGGRPRPKIHWAPEIGRWGIPMPVIDSLVVRRTAAFTDTYPRDFRYEHYLQTRSLARVAGLFAGLGLVFGLAQLAPARKLLGRLRPSGSGPSEEERARSEFRIRFVAEAAGRRIATEVSGGDPGYGYTAKMLASAALTLVEDRDRLPHRGGVLTPALFRCWG